MTNTFDYIIAGSGLAGLSLLYRLAQDSQFASKKILVIDGEQKTKNDRTWCYWEKGEGIFEPIVHHSWSTLSFLTPEFSKTFKMNSYQYKMILGEIKTLPFIQAISKRSIPKEIGAWYRPIQGSLMENIYSTQPIFSTLRSPLQTPYFSIF